MLRSGLSENPDVTTATDLFNVFTEVLAFHADIHQRAFFLQDGTLFLLLASYTTRK